MYETHRVSSEAAESGDLIAFPFPFFLDAASGLADIGPGCFVFGSRVVFVVVVVFVGVVVVVEDGSAKAEGRVLSVSIGLS